MTIRAYLTDPASSAAVRRHDDVPVPDPAPDEVVVSVAAFALDRGELLQLSLRAAGWRPGRDVAGTVVAGAADGSGPPAGSRVVAILDGASWSERIAVPTDRLAVLPDHVSLSTNAGRRR